MRKQTDYIELYTDYLINGNGYATATGLSSIKSKLFCIYDIILYTDFNKVII